MKIPFSSIEDCFTLPNGVRIPCVGYGTWQTPVGGTARRCVAAAVNAGYVHIDTAFIYGNEQEVGQGVRDAGRNRGELFITSKHWVTERGYEKTIAAAELSLKNLGMDYMDLYLIHWPCVAKVSENWAEINADTWRAFERLYADGKVRAIGVSNFDVASLERLIADSSVKPMVNQLEFHPGWTQPENIDFTHAQGLVAQAWSPLGSGAVLKDKRLEEIAAKYGVSVARLCVRYALEKGVLPLPKSTDPDRMRSNADVFGFELSEEDTAAIDAMPVLGYSGFAPQDAPADAIA